jgi:hypothetical protein
MIEVGGAGDRKVGEQVSGERSADGNGLVLAGGERGEWGEGAEAVRFR